MPGKVKVKIIAGKNLPVMDRSSDTTDAYVEIKLGSTTYKTDVCRKSLNPQWNSDWYRFEVDDTELQDEPLQIRLMDHDTYSANDAIGKVYLDLNPLLLPSGNYLPKFGCAGESTVSENVANSVMSGWVPVYDTMHGIRGEVNIIVKVELFSDFNKFRQSSCGVQFFCSPVIPHGYYIQTFHGFVEELIVNDDPEYQWIDKIRTPRASNEARQTLFFKLSGELQRRIGVKALELGGNAVVGYSQCFDLEGESGVVVRGIGTTVTLIKLRLPLAATIDVTSEERVLSYLQFLRHDSGFHLNRDLTKVPSSFPLPETFPVAKPTRDVECGAKTRRDFTRHISCSEFAHSGSVQSLNSIHHASSLQTLLQQEEMRGIPGTGISQKIKNLKYSSQSMLARKMIALKAKLADTPEEDGFKGSTSTLSALDKKRPGFQRSTSESNTMAEILVRSLMHTSLDCINESHDSTTSSSSVLGLEENTLPLISSKIDKSVSVPQLLESEFYLRGTSSNSSSESSSSEDEGLSDARDDANPEYETVSAIIKNVTIDGINIPSDGSSIETEEYEVCDKNEAVKEPTVKPLSTSAPLAQLEDLDANEIALEDVFKPILIIPPPKINTTSMQSQGLLQTAIQTILLEKLNMLGTYTPPSSPGATKKEFEKLSSTSPSQSFFPKLTGMFEMMRKSPTASLKDIPSETRAKKPKLAKRYSSESQLNVSYSIPIPPLTTNANKNSVSNAACTSSPSKPCNMPVNSELDKGSNNMHASLAHSLRPAGSPAAEPARNDYGHQRTESVGAKISQSPARFHPIPYMHRRSSDSDLSITPKGNSLTGSDKSYGLPSGYFTRVGALLRPSTLQDNFDMLEYPFLTLTKYPAGFIIYLGGVVSARSVKLLERISNLEEPESRDTWWTELRMEIRSHARSIGCNAVLAYSESASICDDVCVLSAGGTAAVIGYQYTGEMSDSLSGFMPKPTTKHHSNKDTMASSLDRNDFEKEKTQKSEPVSTGVNSKPLSESPENETHPLYINNLSPCTMCHLPYTSVPLRTTTLKCAVCRSGKVPDVLLATIEMPEGIPIAGRGCFIQAHVCRQLKEARSESGAKDISDGLPFLEYELHRILVNKIKIKGMNAVFGLKVRISIGVKMLVGVATGTAVYLLALPPAPLPKLVSDRLTDDKKLAEMQKLLSDTVKMNKEIYQLKMGDEHTGRVSPENDNLEEEPPGLDLAAESRDCCVLEVDDPEDMEIMNFLMEPRPPDGFHVVNTELVPGLEELEIVKNLQMFTQIWRAKLHPPCNLSKHIHKLMSSVYFKLRRMIPCALCDLQFRVDLPDSDEIQISILGMALGLGLAPNQMKYKRKNVCTTVREARKNDDDMMFKLEDDHLESLSSESGLLSIQTVKHRGKSPQRMKVAIRQHVPHRERHGVDITPLSYVPGGKIERYLGNLNFFFIRETTSIREVGSFIEGGKVKSLLQEGGLSGFIHSFITEVLAIVRAHINALGGNAMVAYYMTKCVLSHSVHKNQGQCLINVGGDVVFVSYFSDE